MIVSTSHVQIIHEYSLYKYFLIFSISFVSNMFSAISGGGAGLIQLPALILSGLPYYQALATHKIATVSLGLGSSIRNSQLLRNDVYVISQILFFGTPGVVLGSSIVKFLSEQFLYLILGILSIFLSMYSIRKKSLGMNSLNKNIKLSFKIEFIITIFIIGILNGSVSSGTGLLVTMLLIKSYKIDFLRAVSLTFFTVGIFWNAIGAILISGSFIGGYLGAHLSNLKGNKLIKNTFTIVCLLVGISLLIKSLELFMQIN